MTSLANVHEELADAVCSLTPTRIEWMVGLGIPRDLILGLPLMVGVDKVQTHSCGLYEPEDGGTDAIIIGAGRQAPPIWGHLEDLIAFRPNDPGRWWCRVGAVQVLGDSSTLRVFPLQLYASPLSWLRAGGQGICIVNWTLDPECLLFAGPIVAERPSLKSRLERRIQQAAVAKFDISVSEVRNAA